MSQIYVPKIRPFFKIASGLIFIFALVYCPKSKADESPFPPEVLNHNTLVDRFFQNFRLYGVYLDANSITLPSDPQSRYYQTVPPAASHFKTPVNFLMTYFCSQGNGEITEGIVFTVNSLPARILNIHQVGPHAKPSGPSRFFAFDFPLPNDDYKYEFILSGFQSDVSIFLWAEGGNVSMTFKMGGTIAYSELKTASAITRNYTTVFPDATGPVFQAIAYKSTRNEWTRKYLIDNVETSPVGFENLFSPWVTDIISTDLPQGLLKSLGSKANWPFTDSVNLSLAGIDQ